MTPCAVRGCRNPACLSLRAELATIFGVPIVREGETWNAAMLRTIADARGGELRQATYVLDLAQQTVAAAENLRVRLASVSSPTHCAVRDCRDCQGDGWYVAAEHDPRCNGSCDFCPVPGQRECETCGGAGKVRDAE